MISRRDSLKMAAGAVLAANLPAHPRESGGDSLNVLANAKGMRFGSAVNEGTAGSINDPRYAALLTAECALLVPEVELKWRAIRPERDRFDFSRFDRILDYAQVRGMAVRGHNLLWQRPQRMPDWVESHDFGARPASEA